MKSIKIVQKFFTKTESAKAKSYQLANAKKLGLLIKKVEIINAHELYRQNGWLKNNPFKKLGLPTPEKFMIIVHYKSEIETKPKSIKQYKVTEPKVSIESKLKIAKMKVSIDINAPIINSSLPVAKVSKRKIANRNKKEKPHIFFTYRPNATYRIAA